LRAKLLTAEIALKDLEATKEKLKISHKTIKALGAKLQNGVKAVEGLEATQGKLQTAENAIKDLETSRGCEVVEHMLKIRELSNEADKHKSENETLKEELTEAKLRLETLKREQVHFKALVKERSEELEASGLALGEVKDKLAQSNVELTASAKRNDKLWNKLKKETAKLRGKNDKLTNELHAKDRELIQQHGEFKSRMRELRDADRELDTVKMWNTELAKMCKKQSKKIKKLEADCGSIITNADSMLADVATLRAEAAAAKSDLNKLNEINVRPLMSAPASANDVILREFETGILKTGTLIASYENIAAMKLKSHEKKVMTLSRKMEHIRTQLELKAVDNGLRERSLYETNSVIQKRQKSRIVQLMKELERFRSESKY